MEYGEPLIAASRASREVADLYARSNCDSIDEGGEFFAQDVGIG